MPLRIRIPIALLCPLLFVMTASFALAESERPNVVLIMTDDQGYGDLSVTGSDIIETPNMDRLAHEGAWVKQFYVSPVCTPTRAHLMTGRYNYRTRAIDTYLGRAVMEPEEVTIAEMLSSAGYKTGIFGKWHLGDYFPTRAIDQGFDEALVHLGGGLRQPANPPEGERYHDPILFRNGTPARYEGYCTDIFFDAAADFIEKQAKAKQPFFAYIPTNAPHGPFDEPPTRELFEHFREKLPNDRNTNRAVFYSMIKNVDQNIGRLLAQLEQLSIERDTLVIFLTDNGPAGGGSAGPFRAAKGSVYEGGIRTVCFLRWPKRIDAGTTVSGPAAHLDLTPTILEACGVAAPESVRFDGHSLLPLVANNPPPSAPRPNRPLFFQWHRGDVPLKFHHFAAIDPEGRWKLVGPVKPNRDGRPKTPKFELYDLKNDPSETTDQAGKHPEIVNELKTAYSEWFDDVSTTRDPNFGMPPIVIGTKQQPTTVLTPQDKRVAATDAGGWWASGSWPIDVRRDAPYTVQVRLNQDAPTGLLVELVVEVDSKRRVQEISIPRGVNSAALDHFRFPAKGLGRVSARIMNKSVGKTKVLHVTFK